MDYNELKNKIDELQEVIKSLENQTFIEKQRDKCGLEFWGSKNYDEPAINMTGNFPRAFISFGATHGSYGSSSSYNDMNLLFAQYILRALRYLEPDILKMAQNLVHKDIQQLAKEAKLEAAKIIQFAELEVNP